MLLTTSDVLCIVFVRFVFYSAKLNANCQQVTKFISWL